MSDQPEAEDPPKDDVEGTAEDAIGAAADLSQDASEQAGGEDEASDRGVGAFDTGGTAEEAPPSQTVAEEGGDAGDGKSAQAPASVDGDGAESGAADAGAGQASTPAAAHSKPKGNQRKARGRGGFPSALEELNLKVTPRGIVVPESRKMVLTRRREAREMGWLVGIEPAPRPAALTDSDRPRKKKKTSAPGVTLDELQSDLFHAAFTGDCDACCEAIAAGVDINVQTKADQDGIGSGGTALHVAATRGHEAVIAALLGAKADPSIVSNRKESPLDLAMKGGHVQAVQVLAGSGAMPLDAETKAKMMRQAPQWDHGRTRRQLHSALSHGCGGKGRPPARRQLSRGDSDDVKADKLEDADDDVKQEHYSGVAEADLRSQEKGSQGKGKRGKKGGKGKKGGGGKGKKGGGG
eukprot:TRINITY_DN38795_c0_g1_i1.p1 TRINITY_DN38795_c0_g1~~TRINITY_DN38795_c0_g1_i1.p1  ORF type:complete len:409 (-),score=79.16 TRINITY_DN38795_c0_g1_i1:56-1282(-)